jgi:hypothetical protein
MDFLLCYLVLRSKTILRKMEFIKSKLSQGLANILLHRQLFQTCVETLLNTMFRLVNSPVSRYGNAFAFATANFKLYIISIAVLENVSPDAGLQKRANFSALIVGLAETGDQTRAICLARSGAYRSAIRYD